MNGLAPIDIACTLDLIFDASAAKFHLSHQMSRESLSNAQCLFGLFLGAAPLH